MKNRWMKAVTMVILGVVLCSSLLTGCGGSSEEAVSTEVGEEDAEGEIDATETEEEESEVLSDRYYYSVGDTVEFTSGLVLTALSAGEYEDDLQGACVYIECDIDNQGEEDRTINMADFAFYADNYKLTTVAPSNTTGFLSVTTISPGRKINARFYAVLNTDYDLISRLEAEIGDVVFVIKDGTADASASDGGGQNISGESAILEDIYQRQLGPSASITIWSIDDDMISFAVSIGYSGANAYIDLRDCEAYWTNDQEAIYTDGDYTMTFVCRAGTGFSIEENMDNPYGLNLAGDYVLASEADYPSCEYVFYDSDEYEIYEGDCEGLTALECKIAKNEIYARHGRLFNDEALQNYFDSCSWYFGTVEPDDFSEDALNDIEVQNLNTISNYMSAMGY